MSTIIRPTWPLGLHFVDARAREFEVTEVVMGDPGQGGYEMELTNGWKIHSQFGEHQQREVGFVNIADRTKVIRESVNKLDQFVKDGHLKLKGYEI